MLLEFEKLELDRPKLRELILEECQHYADQKKAAQSASAAAAGSQDAEMQ